MLKTTEHDELRRLLSDVVSATIAAAPMAMALLGASSLLLHHHPRTALQFPCTSISATITTQGTSPSSSSSSCGSRQQRESLSRRNELKPREEPQARSSEQLLQFEREGHSCVRNLFDATEMASLEAIVSAAAARERLNSYRHRVAVLCPGVDPFSLHSVSEAESVIRKKGTDDLGFLQSFNLHLKLQAVRQWASHPKLVTMAAAFLGAKRVRLYQDCLFMKMPGFGVTNWHSDLNMVPIDTNSFVTVWIPLRALDSTDSSLHFASGSHRDFSLAYWQNNQGMANLKNRNYPVASYSNLELGDATIHHGWTLHWAPEQPASQPPRAAWTVSYFSDGARILQTKHARRKLQEEDAWSFQGWRKDLKEGQMAHHPSLPLVYPLKLEKGSTRQKRSSP